MKFNKAEDKRKSEEDMKKLMAEEVRECESRKGGLRSSALQNNISKFTLHSPLPLSQVRLAKEATEAADKLASLWFGLAKAHCRCGQMFLAIRACNEALSIPDQTESMTKKVSSVLTHWQALSDSERPFSSFEEEVNTPLPNLFDKYMSDSNQMLKIDWDEMDLPDEKVGDVKAKSAEASLVADYRKKLKLSSVDLTGVESEDLKHLHTIEDIEMHLTTKRRWKIFKEGMKSMAREILKGELVDCFTKMAGKMERDCGDDAIVKIAKLGFNCASEDNGGPNDTTQLAVGSCLLLAKAFDFEYLDIVKKQNPSDRDAYARAEAKLWRARAICHWRVYEKQGLGSGKGERAHLDNSIAAWDHALKHMAVAGDPKNWVSYAKALTCKGNYEIAANSYGTVLRSFRVVGIQNIAVTCSSLLKALGSYDQSVAYLFSAISMEMEPPYDSIDLAFLMARLHEEYAFFVQKKKTGEAEGKVRPKLPFVASPLSTAPPFLTPSLIAGGGRIFR